MYLRLTSAPADFESVESIKNYQALILFQFSDRREYFATVA